MDRNHEKRSFGFTWLREAGGNDQIILRGYAAVFNQLSDDLGGFRERVLPGAFAKTLKEADVRALWQHNVNYVLGRIKNKTLRLWEDTHGLTFEILPPNTQWASDFLTSIRRGDVSQMSFSFEAVHDRWEDDPSLGIIRTLVEVRLLDISPVTFPAYPRTSVSVQVRAKVSELQRKRAYLDILRHRLLLEELAI